MIENRFPTPLPTDATPLTLAHFNYDLPEQLIAQMPAAERSASRLLVVHGENDVVDERFTDIVKHLKAGDVLVMNNTKVIKARLFGHKASGGKVEVMFDRVTGTHRGIAQIRASKTPAIGSTLRINDAFHLTVLAKNDRFYELESDAPILEMLEQHGHLPLPPYIDHAADDFDANRYQTVFAEHAGAVAAPTAGLHFDEHILKALTDKGVQLAYVTLHVGAGTFLPVSSENLDAHVMHQEWFEIPAHTADVINAARLKGGRVVAVGTTSLRALESAAALQNPEYARDWQLQPHSADTKLFIRPPYRFRLVDVLVTNFHLPQSTLLMLVSAFSGVETMRGAYNHAISQGYRFFSYGDAMILTCCQK
ncbi:tRNA preQ1(34) S-adenosylmethionine ribosyltransferase-isomerase QueA [Hydromonas duriensis]|nr:tRNA preQ1(34) S-adenosylmethionine ribosyltransferase-isomerase QueA [Hydromonas duriensis]